MGLERFEAWIHPADRDYIQKYKIAHRCTSNADALRRIIEEHRRASVTLTGKPCLSNKLQ